MKYIRILRKGMTGEDVRYIKNCLFSLGYYSSEIKIIKNNTFGEDTLKAVKTYQKNNRDIFGKQLEIDGIIGEKTWYAIERDFEAKSGLKFTRNLKNGMSGNDVKYIKNCLFNLKYYSSNITSIKTNTFGADTIKAVELFQSTHNLVVDAIVGKLTWMAIEKDFQEKKIYISTQVSPVLPVNGLLDNYTHISIDKRRKIEKDLINVSDIRKKLVLEILKYVYDHDKGGNVRALYIIGDNLYNRDLTLNKASISNIENRAKSSGSKSYFTNGRKEWMIEQIKKQPGIASSDCSGMEIGYMRKFKIVSPGFDTTANGLCGNEYSSAVAKSALKPGDWVGKDGHIGTYVGGGYVVEFAGGAYGCQLTTVNERKCYDFIKKRVVKLSNWTKFRKPKYY